MAALAIVTLRLEMGATMSIALRILGWGLMIFAVLLEVVNVFMLMARPNWGLVEFLTNTAIWAVPFIGGYYINRAGKSLVGGPAELS